MFVTSQLRTDENESLMLLRSLLEPKTMDDVIDAGGSIIWQNHVQRWLTTDLYSYTGSRVRYAIALAEM